MKKKIILKLILIFFFSNLVNSIDKKVSFQIKKDAEKEINEEKNTSKENFELLQNKLSKEEMNNFKILNELLEKIENLETFQKVLKSVKILVENYNLIKEKNIEISQFFEKAKYSKDLKQFLEEIFKDYIQNGEFEDVKKKYETLIIYLNLFDKIFELKNTCEKINKFENTLKTDKIEDLKNNCELLKEIFEEFNILKIKENSVGKEEKKEKIKTIFEKIEKKWEKEILEEKENKMFEFKKEKEIKNKKNKLKRILTAILHPKNYIKGYDKLKNIEMKKSKTV